MGASGLEGQMPDIISLDLLIRSSKSLGFSVLRVLSSIAFFSI
jgi:hypothetical protein